MAKFRFKTIFDRMLFLQCVTVLTLLLSVGAGIGYVSRVQSMKREENRLIRAAQEAEAVLSDSQQTDFSSLKISARERDVLIQAVYENQTLSFYEDEKWAAAAALERDSTKYKTAIKSVSDAPESSASYIRGQAFPILTVYASFSRGNQSGLLLVHGDITDLNESFTETLTWTVVICTIAAFAVLIVSYFIANRVINPFVEINHTVQCYSKGDFTQRIAVQGRDEASQLGRSFNEMAEQLKDLEATRRSFVANVSHELRSPLTSMKGFLEAMMDGTIPPEEQGKYIEIVLSETRRMNVMVNDLLDLARIESGIITLSYEVFDINELIRRTLITFEARISEKQLELDVRFAVEQTYVYADSNQISQVLRNLIDNAIKYSPDGKSLTISTYPLRKEVYVVIRDTGVGIPAEDVPHVFDRFYKVEKAHTPSPQVGSGLGLAIVKKIIEAHGQSITVKSARGRGTQFTFTLQKANPLKRVTDGGRKNG